MSFHGFGFFSLRMCTCFIRGGRVRGGGHIPNFFLLHVLFYLGDSSGDVLVCCVDILGDGKKKEFKI